MKKRYKGFLASNGLYILDTNSGEVRFVYNNGNKVEEGILNMPEPNLLNSNTKSQNQFENEIIASFPYLIAKPFSHLIMEKDFRVKCKLMVDTFTAVLKYLALQLASEYIRAKDVRDLQVHQTLTKDLSRPLISSWNNLIARCLPVLKDHNIPFFSPEINDAYEALESKCKDPKWINQKYSDENGDIKIKKIKLGKIQAFIKYRNGLAHGFTKKETIAKKEFEEYYPLLRDILQEVRFISRYTLWYVKSSKQGVNGIRLMGSNPSLEKVEFNREGLNPAVSPLFLINDSSGEILPLYAFFDVDESSDTGLPEIGKDVFVFEGNTKNTVIYLSSNGEHLEKSSRFLHWKELLAQKKLEVEWANTKNLTLEILNSIGLYISATGIQALIASAKYLREATISRQDLNELLDTFSYGEYNGFVLGGESGIGKSTLLAQKTEEWQAEEHMVTFYRASSLNQSDIISKFLRDSALNVDYFEGFLSMVNPIFSKTDKKCYLIIDALNEFTGDLDELIKSVDNIVEHASNYPWFKIIVSIRDSSYNRVTSRFGEMNPLKYFMVDEEKGGEKVRTNIIRIQPFTKDFVEQLYNAYRDYKWKDDTDIDSEGYYKFRPLNHFSELDSEGSTVKLIRSPLMARLLMQSFHRSILPQHLNNDDAMRLYYNNIVLEKTEDSLGFPERKKFLKTLVFEFDKYSVERLERDELMENMVLKSYLINSQRDSPFVQLLDIGVLMQEWENDNCYLRFAFDKFFEFMLAELHDRVNTANELLVLCERACEYKILQGAVEIIMDRICLNNNSKLIIELIDLVDEKNETIRLIVKEIICRTLFNISRDNFLNFTLLLDLLKENPTNLDLEIIIDLLDKTYSSAEIPAFMKLVEVGIDLAKVLDNKSIAIILKCYEANYENDYGEPDIALNKYSELLANFDLKNESKLHSDILNRIGVIYTKLGDFSKAMNKFMQSLSMKKKCGDYIGYGRNLNSLGLISLYRNNINEAYEYFNESLEIFDKHNSNRDFISTLNFLGRTDFESGNDNSAVNNFRRAFELAKNNKYIEAVFGSVHRAFSLMIDTERDYCLRFLESYKTITLSNRCSSLLANIRLMQYCFINKKNSFEFQELYQNVLISKDNFKTNELDDLPINAFYQVSKLLAEEGQFEDSKKIAIKALEWLGDRNSRRKIELEKIVNYIESKILKK